MVTESNGTGGLPDRTSTLSGAWANSSICLLPLSSVMTIVSKAWSGKSLSDPGSICDGLITSRHSCSHWNLSDLNDTSTSKASSEIQKATGSAMDLAKWPSPSQSTMVWSSRASMTRSTRVIREDSFRWFLYVALTNWMDAREVLALNPGVPSL